MKKIYILLLTLSISITSIAQIVIQELTSAKGKKSYNSTILSAEKSAPFWSEDFANGIPLTWNNGNTPWVYRGPGTSPNNSTGSQGAYASNSTPIASATASNGFIIFDSDFYDNNGVAGAFGTGAYATPHTGELMTDMIDMSQYTDVTLTFHSYYRTFAGQAFVDFYVSGNFVERVQVHSDIDINDATFTDEVALVRVPFSVVGNTDVQMSFVFDGSSNTVNGFQGYYFWQIDDVALMETPANLIGVEDVVIGGFWIDYANYVGQGLNVIVGLDYSITPTSQLANHPYVIEGVLRNNGSSDQYSTLNYTDNTFTYTGSSTTTSVPALNAFNVVDSVIVAASPAVSPPVGTYQFAIWGSSDSSGIIVASTDTVFKQIEISDYIYAKDLGQESGSWIIGGPNDQNHVTTRFEMYADEALTGLRAYITDESVPGSEIKAMLYELDSTVSNAAGGVVLLAESDNYAITQADLGNWVDIPFVDPVNLFNGYAYEFGISGLQHPTDSVFVGTSGTSLYNGEHSLFDEFGLNPVGSATAGTPTWYYITGTPMVRMNFDPSLIASVGDFKNMSFNVYPNPSSGVFNIELPTNNTYDILVTNALGQVVFSNTTNDFITSIDLSNFSKGIYTIDLVFEDNVFHEEIIIK